MLSSDSYVRVMVSLRLYVEVKNVSVYLWFPHLNLSLWYFRTAIELGKFILLILTKVLNYFCKKDWLAYVFCPRGVSHKKIGNGLILSFVPGVCYEKSECVTR